MLNDIKALVFDLDGTLYVNSLLGSEIYRSAIGYMVDLKGTAPEEADRLVREARICPESPSDTEATLSSACLELGGDLRELHRRFAAEIDPGRYLARDERVVDLLKTLGSTFELYIYTNNNRILSEAILDILGIGRLFRQVFTIEDYWQPKPDNSVLQEIFRQIGRTPDECLFVGDRYDIDLRLPAAFGCAVFLVTAPEDLFHLCKFVSQENL